MEPSWPDHQQKVELPSQPETDQWLVRQKVRKGAAGVVVGVATRDPASCILRFGCPSSRKRLMQRSMIHWKRAGGDTWKAGEEEICSMQHVPCVAARDLYQHGWMEGVA